MSGLVRLRLLGRSLINDQAVQHRFFYGLEGLDPVDFTDLAPLAVDFKVSVLPVLVATIHESIRYETIEVRDDVLGNIHIEPLGTEGVGELVGSVSPLFVAVKIALQRFDTQVKSGRKIFSGVVETDFDNQGDFTNAGVETRWLILALRLTASLASGNPSEDFLPFLAKLYVEATGTFAAANPIAAAIVRGLTTIRSRKQKFSPV